MQPKHLPDLWSVDHQQERLDVKAAENRIDREQYLLATKVGTYFLVSRINSDEMNGKYFLPMSKPNFLIMKLASSISLHATMYIYIQERL